ncbi:MAG TPA: hypothetical protein VFA65_01340 [Bryobacteraceae bacterium]|nr:hypothetical protein [Bryobacteraceae bacterium]
MLKRVAVAVLALASFGAVLPMSAAAAERGREETRVVVKKDDRSADFRRDVRPDEQRFRARVDERPVVVHKAPLQYYTSVRCR